MAHVDAQRGLRWVNSLHGGNSAPPMRAFTIPAATTLYTGCLVQISNAGVISLVGAAAVSANNRILGVSPGYLPSSAAVTPNYPLIMPLHQVFTIQAGNSTTAFDTLAEVYTALSTTTRYGFLSGASTVTGLNVSSMELDAAAPGTTTRVNIFSIVGYPDRPDNAIHALGGDLKVHVIIEPTEIAEAFA